MQCYIAAVALLQRMRGTEAWELVEDGTLETDQFRSFTFANAARLMTATNPDFFQGTAVEAAVSAL